MTDPTGCALSQLCELLRSIGATLTLHGQPVTEVELRAKVDANVASRLAAIATRLEDEVLTERLPARGQGRCRSCGHFATTHGNDRCFHLGGDDDEPDRPCRCAGFARADGQPVATLGDPQTSDTP